MKILIVDDDPIAISLILAALEEYGFTDVVTALSGVDALKIIETMGVRFDCFLLDQRMPDMDGVTLCGYLRRYDEYKTSPVIFITAVTDRSCIDKAFTAGAIDFVTKPIEPMEIGIRVSVAEKLVLEERATRKFTRQVRAAQSKLDKVLRLTVDEPVVIPGVAAVVGKLAFENYLQSLGKAKLHNSAITAFAINDFDLIFRKAHPTEVFLFLTDIARAIVKSMKHTDKLITYNGYGQFLCVTKRGDEILDDRLASYINANIAQFDLSYEDGSPCSASVRMGKPAQPAMLVPASPRQLMQQALTSAVEKKPGARRISAVGTTAQSYSSPLLNI